MQDFVARNIFVNEHYVLSNTHGDIIEITNYQGIIKLILIQITILQNFVGFSKNYFILVNCFFQWPSSGGCSRTCGNGITYERN